MSKASDVRDAVIDAIKNAATIDHPAEFIQAFWTPDFVREDLEQSAIIGVAVSGRETLVEMGPDMRRVELDIGVFGLPDLSNTASLDTRRTREAAVAAGDRLDAIVETLQAHWMAGSDIPGSGSFIRQGMAGHSFHELPPSTPYDASLFHDQRIWAGVFSITYNDSDDQ